MPRLLFCSVLVSLLVACATEEASSPHLLQGASKTNAGNDDGTSAPAASAAGNSSSAPGSTTPASDPPKSGVPVNAIKTGMATFYAANGTGNCSYPASKDLMVVAPNKARLYDGSAACGECMKVTGKKGSVTVRVVDSCPIDTPDNDCGDTNADLDLSAQAFAAIEDPSVGMANITFQVVPCAVTGTMEFEFKSGSTQWWTAVQVRNHREPIATVEYSQAGDWINMPRTDDNYFTADNGVGDQPQGLPLRITSVYGQVVLETLPIDDSKVLTGQHQFD